MSDIQEYLNIYMKNNKFKREMTELFSRQFYSLLTKYEKIVIGRIIGKDSATLTVSDVADVIQQYFEELNSVSNKLQSASRMELIKLKEALKSALDNNYPIDYQLLPESNVDYFPTVSEISKVIDRYKTGEFSETRTKRILGARMRKPAHVVNTVLNTQLAGFDNTSSLSIASAAGLNKAMYFGPYRAGFTRLFCEKLLMSKQLYTENQIKGMDNGQGLPVIRYCGGYNCMHEWMWVDESWSEIKNRLK